MERFAFENRLHTDVMDERLLRLYNGEKIGIARTRCNRIICRFRKAFGTAPEALFSSPGRTELGGNHTDHQHGCVLAASIDLDIIAAASANPSGKIRVLSEGYPLFEVELSDLASKPEEKYTPAALVRGIAAQFRAFGCPLAHRGADIAITSDVPPGSGLSSSAAFEVLIATVFNDFFLGGRCSAMELAQISQHAENAYFGKPCGLMDQMACAIGGAVAMDFADPEHPEAKQIPVDFNDFGFTLCILDSGAGHADLTHEYAAITKELKSVSRYFGKDYLREVPEKAFLSELKEARKAAGDRAVLRALHFYGETRRVQQEVQALEARDFGRFLSLVRESGRSSAQLLQNIVPLGQTNHQELMFTLALCERILGDQGAVRVHGGGFGGTAQAYVPVGMFREFQIRVESVLSQGSCRALSIRPTGATRMI